MKVWQAVVVVEFPVQDGEEVPMFYGDAPIDYASRAVTARIRPALEQMRAALGAGSHWTLRFTADGALAEVKHA